MAGRGSTQRRTAKRREAASRLRDGRASALGGLSSRMSEVLLAVVREYVRTGQPVASE